MTVETLVLGRLVPNDGFAHEVAARIRKEQAAVARLLEGTLAAEWNRSGLELLATYIEARPRHDQRLYALYAVSTSHGDSDRYVPGESQRAFMASVGATGYRPSVPDELLNELVAAAIEDALALRDRSAQSLAARDEQCRSLVRQLQEAREAGTLVLQEAEQLREHAGQLTAQAEAIQDENASLGSLIDTLTERAQRAEQELADLKPKAERWRAQLREERPLLRERNSELRTAEARIAELEEELHQCKEGQA